MYELLKEQLEGFEDLVIKESPNYHAMITLRHRLIHLDEERRQELDAATPAFSDSVHAGVAARCRLDLTALEDLEQVEGLVIPFANIVFKLMIAMSKDGFSVSDINALCERDMKLELT